MSQPALDFGEPEPSETPDPTYSVGGLADAINDTLKLGFSEGVWVRGEITGWSDRGNHAYFTLSDDAGGSGKGRGKAVVNVQFFANVRSRLRPLLKKHRLELADGVKVRVFGYLDYYAPTGRIGLKMTDIDPRHTLGELAQGRDEVMRRLTSEGLLDANSKQLLSRVPLRVGVVASVGTAAWHDFSHELEQSSIGFQLTVVDTRVQSDLAEREVSASISTLARRADLDVIVVIRGGGARNELAVFDDERIARAIATSPVPVFTGIGHEIDRSVADEVAHTSLKTPTACAGQLIALIDDYTRRTEQVWTAIQSEATASLSAATASLSESAHRIARQTHAAVERADERLNMSAERISMLAPAALFRADQQLSATTKQLLARATAVAQRANDRLDVAAARVAAFDPALQHARGWSITRRADGTVIRATTEVASGEQLVTSVADGTIISTVTASQTDQPSDSKPLAPTSPSPKE